MKTQPIFGRGMIKKICKFTLVSFLFLSFFTHADDVNKNDASLDIPYQLVTKSYESDIIIGETDITILARKGTDLYTNADGSHSNDNAPRVFFEPKSDFTLSAKVTANFISPYDGGALFLYADTESWGKLLFERFKSGDNGIASTVTNLTGDDAYHYLVDNDYIYFKIARKVDTFSFYYSKNGEDWSYLRSFSLTTPKAIKVGFLAQSPISQTHKVVYSNIVFQE